MRRDSGLGNQALNMLRGEFGGDVHGKRRIADKQVDIRQRGERKRQRPADLGRIHEHDDLRGLGEHGAFEHTLALRAAGKAGAQRETGRRHQRKVDVDAGDKLLRPARRSRRACFR